MEEDRDTSMKDHFPEPHKRFWMRSRKRRNSDAASVSSMDISMGSESIKKKKRRRITEVATSFFTSSSSSSTSTPSKFGSVLQRSFSSQISHADLSLLGEETDSGTIKKETTKLNAQRLDRLTTRSWIVDIADIKSDGNFYSSLSRGEVKRQEAIYELCCGEEILLRDLNNLKEFYYEPLIRSDILTKAEIYTLFGDIDGLVNIHEKLKDDLVNLRNDSGYTESVGSTLVNWLPGLAALYVDRCRTQVWARHLLDAKRATNKRFQEFLKKRSSVPRSVDLWTYLDVPRSRIVKYPILVNEILRHTPSDHRDEILLRKAGGILSKLLKEIDKAMGNSECKLAQSRINASPIYDAQQSIQNSGELITEGQLRDARGTKLHCFLFDNCFVLARPARRVGRKCNPCFPVLKRSEFNIQSEVAIDGKIFETGFKIGEHILNTDDEHSKRHWIESFRRMNLLAANGVTCDENSSESKENTVRKVGKVSESSPQISVLKDTRKRKSVGDLCGGSFPISLRKSLIRDKRNSIGLL